jgi:colanic acid biosynthesis glycosyl transferase WcaI
MAKILFLVANFPPEISTGRLEHELSLSFVRNKHSVSLVTSFPRRYLVNKPRGRILLPFYKEIIDGIKVLRMGPEFSNRDNVFLRGFEYFFEFFSFFLGGLISGKADIIICSSPPLTLALAGYFIGKIKHIPVIVRVGDLHPQELADMGMIKSRLLMNFLELIERFIYKKCDFFTVLSEGYRRHLLNRGASSNRVWVVPNWGNTKDIEVLERSHVTIRGNGRFVVTYAGTMSWFQDLETMIDAAFRLRNYENIHFLFVGDGGQKAFLEEKSRNLRLDNVSFFPLKPRLEYLRTLCSSDVCVVAIKKEVKTTTVPSKLFDIMACGRPVIANVPYGEISDIIFKSKSGIWIEPQNPEKFAEAVLKLYENSNTTCYMGQNGRDYLDTHFSLKAAVFKYEQLIKKMLPEKEIMHAAKLRVRISGEK